MDKGRTFPLLHTVAGRERILVALSWDERKDKANILQRVMKSHTQHDLDLACFVYDSKGDYIDYVGAMAQDSIDSTGAIYHSGDDATGEGLGDDESISVELGGLPGDTEHLVFVTEIRSGHVFADVLNPRARFADGMTDSNLFTLEAQEQESAQRQAWVMARLYRSESSPTGWAAHVINDFPSLDDVADWGSYLARYLR